MTGGISIVVPDFARCGVDLSKWAVYRLLPSSGWTKMKADEKETFFEIIEDTPEQKRANTWYKFWLWL